MALRATKGDEDWGGCEYDRSGGECGRGCDRSGEFETAREPDPDRACGPISESCLSARKGDSS